MNPAAESDANTRSEKSKTRQRVQLNIVTVRSLGLNRLPFALQQSPARLLQSFVGVAPASSGEDPDARDGWFDLAACTTCDVSGMCDRELTVNIIFRKTPNRFYPHL